MINASSHKIFLKRMSRYPKPLPTSLCVKQIGHLQLVIPLNFTLNILVVYRKYSLSTEIMFVCFFTPFSVISKNSVIYSTQHVTLDDWPNIFMENEQKLS